MLSVLIKITQLLSNSQAPESTLLTALPCYPVMPTHLPDFIDPRSPRSSQWLLLPPLSPITHTHTHIHILFLSHTHPLLQPCPTISGNSVHPVFMTRPLHRLSSPSGMPFPLSLTWPALSSLPIHHHLRHPGHRCQVACVEGMTGRLRSTEGREAETLKRPSSQSLSPFPSEC